MATRPTSATATWVSLLGLLAFLACVAWLRTTGWDQERMGLVAMVATALPMMLAEVLVRKVHRRASTGLDLDREPLARSWARLGTKLLGLGLTLGVLAFVYTFIPEYQRSFYGPAWKGLALCWPYLLAGGLPYAAWVDRRMADPHDAYWQLGRFVLGHGEDLKRDALKQHVLGWVIKGFYLPMMFAYTSDAVHDLANWRLEHVFSTPPSLVSFVAKLSLAVDLVFVVIGYSLTLRLIDSHIRTSNPLAWGWVVTLVLYTPFWGLVGKRYFLYDDGHSWTYFFGDSVVILHVWAALIVTCKLCWAWSNMVFGTRFSNLTNRGVLTHGPYGITKHPSYVSKNLAWWLLSVPFLHDEGSGAAAQMCLGLLGVNLLYVLRAKAEEHHLSEDPDYVAYAEWMDEHGAFRWVGRLAPWFRYRAPKG